MKTLEPHPLVGQNDWIGRAQEDLQYGAIGNGGEFIPYAEKQIWAVAFKNTTYEFALQTAWNGTGAVRIYNLQSCNQSRIGAGRHAIKHSDNV